MGYLIRTEQDVVRVLDAIGIDEPEERVYRALLDAPGSSLAELSANLQLSVARVRGSLASLETQALVSRTPAKPTRFVPAPPDVALEALIVARQEALERTRVTARQLAEAFRASVLVTNP